MKRRGDGKGREMDMDGHVLGDVNACSRRDRAKVSSARNGKEVCLFSLVSEVAISGFNFRSHLFSPSKSRCGTTPQAAKARNSSGAVLVG
jgi:hypothetical protein